jgi:hypothetical protein
MSVSNMRVSVLGNTHVQNVHLKVESALSAS